MASASENELADGKTLSSVWEAPYTAQPPAGNTSVARAVTKAPGSACASDIRGACSRFQTCEECWVCYRFYFFKGNYFAAMNGDAGMIGGADDQGYRGMPGAALCQFDGVVDEISAGLYDDLYLLRRLLSRGELISGGDGCAQGSWAIGGDIYFTDILLGIEEDMTQ